SHMIEKRGDRNMLSLRTHFASLLLTGLCAGIAIPASAQQTLRVAGNFAVEHSSTDALKVFAEELAQLTNNELAAEVFPSMQTGSATENVTAVRQGALFMTAVGMPYLARVVPELDAVSLPFLFKDRETAFRVVDGDVGDVLTEKMAAK